MLPAANRLRASSEFSNTVRSGVRSGRRNLVLYALVEPSGVAEKTSLPSRVGFIVAKSVGNAVVRNLVKRRLRSLAASTVLQYPFGLRIVVRALPLAATSSWQELQNDYEAGFRASLSKIPETVFAEYREGANE
ncbi:ribonuclease P protein component [Renibacterium salmoninarum]|nr:ribonuclease P protein component [Renibacterium salmoninarum]